MDGKQDRKRKTLWRKTVEHEICFKHRRYLSKWQGLSLCERVNVYMQVCVCVCNCVSVFWVCMCVWVYLCLCLLCTCEPQSFYILMNNLNIWALISVPALGPALPCPALPQTLQDICRAKVNPYLEQQNNWIFIQGAGRKTVWQCDSNLLTCTFSSTRIESISRWFIIHHEQ